jgi:hypothetical protein
MANLFSENGSSQGYLRTRRAIIAQPYFASVSHMRIRGCDRIAPKEAK